VGGVVLLKRYPVFVDKAGVVDEAVIVDEDMVVDLTK